MFLLTGLDRKQDDSFIQPLQKWGGYKYPFCNLRTTINSGQGLA